MAIDAKRVKEIFLEAADLSDTSARAAHLDKACGSDAELRARVEALLHFHDQGGSLLGQAPAAAIPNPHVGTMVFAGTPEPEPDAKDETLAFLAPPQRSDSLGRLGHYEVLQVLGKGGFGIVFRAFDDVLHRVVAVKVLAPHIATTSPARKRFLREARSSAQVRHENAVQVYEVGEQPLPYLVMEFIPGETLQEKLDRMGPLEVPEVLRIGRQISEGLAAAHNHDLIHRDIKPSNILLEGGSHHVKITDFGLARAADDASISQSGILAGTPMFMAPEQAQGQPIDHRADLFSLGSVLYQMVTGRPPFRANTMVAVLKRVAEDQPRAIREIIPETPQWLCDIIAKLHAKNPDDRFGSAREVADLLADCETELKAKQEVKCVLPIPTKPAVPKAPARRRWGPAVAVLFLLLSVVALAGTELTGLTHLFQTQSDPIETDESKPDKVAKKDTPDPVPNPPLAIAPFGTKFALAFDGRQSIVSIPTLSRNDTRVLTAEGYFTPYRIGSGKERLQTILQMNGSHHLQLSQTGSAWRGFQAVGVNALGQTDNGTARVGQRVHVAMTITKAMISLFVDGKPAGPAVSRLKSERSNETGTTLGGGVALCLQDNPSFFAGTIDEVRISTGTRYDTAFTPAAHLEKDATTLALYHFDEGQGDVLTDSSGNGHHGKIVGAKWVKVEAPLAPNRGAKGELESAAGPAHPAPTAHDTWLKAIALLPLDQHALAMTAKLKERLPGFEDAMLRNIPSMPADRQAIMAEAWLRDRNPAFEGKLTHTIERGVLTSLEVTSPLVQDLTPLQSLTELRTFTGRTTLGYDNQAARDAAVLQALKKLETINGKPVAQFWNDAEVKQAEFKEWLQLVPTLNAKQQVAAVADKLKERNPGYKDGGQHKINDDVVTEMTIDGQEVTDLSPLRALVGLKVLTCTNGPLSDLSPLKAIPLTSLALAGCSQIQDITPLKGMPLTWLDLRATQISDLEPLKGMPLTSLNLQRAAHVRDLEPLKGMPLTSLSLGGCAQIRDLELLKGMPLKTLIIFGTGVADLKPLQGMELTEIRLTPKNITQGLEILRDMKSLNKIGIGLAPRAWPAAEFWERYDKGEFKE